MKIEVWRYTYENANPAFVCGAAGCGKKLEPEKDFIVRINNYDWCMCEAHITNFLKYFKRDDSPIEDIYHLKKK